MEKNNSCPRVFISYSWTVRGKVKELADRLSANGIEVVIDLWDLKPGQDKYVFMEQCVNDETISKVLVICDKSYCEKANSRKEGVGDETTIISPEIYGKIEQEKFIPIVFEKDIDGKAYLPHYMKSRIYIDLSSEDEHYEVEYEVLLRNIHNKPLYTKPAIGNRPEWLDEQNVDYYIIKDIIKQLRGVNIDNKKKIAALTKKAELEILTVIKSFKLDENKIYDDALLETIEKMKPFRDIIIEYVEACSETNDSLSTIVVALFESLYNSLHEVSDLDGNQVYLLDAYDFFIWELFICISACCLHWGRYKELREILIYSYYLREGSSDRYDYANYDRFWKRIDVIEDVCKPKCHEPRLTTLQGYILSKRESKPMITRESICSTDILLNQFYKILLSDKDSWLFWYPISYVYSDRQLSFWMKLKSKRYCESVFPLFNVKSIDELKTSISQLINIDTFHSYPCASKGPISIRDSIKLEEIGLIN